MIDSVHCQMRGKRSRLTSALWAGESAKGNRIFILDGGLAKVSSVGTAEQLSLPRSSTDHLQVTWIWAWSKHICHKTITVKFSISVLGSTARKHGQWPSRLGSHLLLYSIVTERWVCTPWRTKQAVCKRRDHSQWELSM